jgi:DnaJ-class molecular chaperone
MGGPRLLTDYSNDVRTLRDLRLKFLFFSKKFHPDKNGNLDAKEQHEMGHKFAQLKEDYSLLKDMEDLKDVDYKILRRPLHDSEDEADASSSESEGNQSRTTTTTDHEEQAQILREEKEWIHFMKHNSMSDSAIWEEAKELEEQNDRELKTGHHAMHMRGRTISGHPHDQFIDCFVGLMSITILNKYNIYKYI